MAINPLSPCLATRQAARAGLCRTIQGAAMFCAAALLVACAQPYGGGGIVPIGGVGGVGSVVLPGPFLGANTRASASLSVSSNGETARGPDTIAGYMNESSFLPQDIVDHGQLRDVAAVYSRNQLQPLWHDGQNWLPAALETVAVLQKAKRHGLNPRDYLSSTERLPNLAYSNPAAIAQAEIRLTSGLMRYILDTKEGRFAPTKRLSARAEFLAGAQSRDYVQWLESLGSNNWMYRRMVNATGQHQNLTGSAWDRYRVTMEQLRWDAPSVPTSGRYVLLNIGSAEVWAMDGLNLDLGVNAVVGRSSRRTPLNDDTITNVKFSPDWTAPYSIVEKDLVRFAKDDPGFVNLMGVEITRNGKKVDPFSLDWDTINVRNYVFRQPPGPTNVLGGVRFSLQNSQAIYMHDSPDKSLFDDPFRAQSSGCVRVGASDEFALWLLQGEDPSWTLDRVRRRMREDKSSFEQLSDHIQVKTIYTTAWVSHNGVLVTFPDAYGVNETLRRRMGLPIERVDDKGLTRVEDLGDVF